MKLKHFSKTVIGLVRKANEDYIGSNTNIETNGNGDVFVVCDGMGGHVGGAIASKTAVESILQYFKNDSHPNPVIALEKAISFANAQIYQLSQNDPDLTGMGTTCTVLLQKDNQIYIAHVGDSRIYLNTDGKMYRVTKDHSFVQKLVDAGQLKDSEMETHPRKNELTRALGISEQVEVEVSEKPLLVKNGDKFLMCSDGLCGLVNDPTISYIINKESGPNVVDELISLAENAGGNDNISVDIIDVISSPHLKTIFKDQTNKTDDFSETQILEVSSMKSDRNIAYLKKFKYYILSSVLILISILYFAIPKSSPLINESDDTIPESTNKVILIPITDDKENENNEIKDIEAKKDSIVLLEQAVIEEDKKNKIKKDKEKLKEQRKKDSIAKVKKEETKINSDLYDLISSKVKEKLKNLSKYDQNTNIKSFKKNLENDLTELDINKNDLNFLKSFNKQDSLYNDILKYEDRKLDSLITNAINLITEVNQLTISSERRENFIKNELKELELKIKQKSYDLIEKAKNKLNDKKVELEEAIKKISEIEGQVVNEKYKWDKISQSLATTKPHLIGPGNMYIYSEDDKNLNKKYLSELKSIKRDTSLDASLILKVEEDIPNEDYETIWIYFTNKKNKYTREKSFTTKELKKLKKYSNGEDGTEKIYVKKRI